MSAHTPEPWRIHNGYSGYTQFPGDVVIESAADDEWCVAIAIGDVAEVPAEANAKRIIACVNACAGMSDPEAEIARLKGLDAIPERWTPDMTQGVFNKDALAYEIGRVFGEHGAHAEVLQALIRERDALRAERDAIAAELEYAIDQMLRHDFGTLSVVPRLRAALARSQK